jgi:hypothetical protein
MKCRVFSQRYLQVAAMFSALLRIDPQQMPGYQKLNGSNSYSVFYERILRELSAEPGSHDRRPELQQPKLTGSPTSSSSDSLSFAKRLFEADDSA